jgi:hypothetical protein
MEAWGNFKVYLCETHLGMQVVQVICNLKPLLCFFKFFISNIEQHADINGKLYFFYVSGSITIEIWPWCL